MPIEAPPCLALEALLAVSSGASTAVLVGKAVEMVTPAVAVHTNRMVLTVHAPHAVASVITSGGRICVIFPSRCVASWMRKTIACCGGTRGRS